MMTTVYNEDCMIGMARYPDKYFDIAIVDPPYGIGRDGATATTSKHGGRKAHPFKGWDSQSPQKTYFVELFRVSKNQIIWGANYFSRFLPSSMGWIFWDKGQGIYNSDGELAFTSFKRALRVYDCNRVQLQVEGTTIHPTQKPIALYDWLIVNYAKDCKNILDTHVGSGSSRIAAQKHGKDFTGFEIDREYWQAQEDRFARFMAQGVLFC